MATNWSEFTPVGGAQPEAGTGAVDWSSFKPVLPGPDLATKPAAAAPAPAPDGSEPSLARRLTTAASEGLPMPLKMAARVGPAMLESSNRTISDAALDAGITLLKGAIGLPEAFVGLMDLPTKGAVGKTLEDAGYRPREAKEILDTYLSEAQQAANKRVKETKGLLPTVGAAIENPSTIATAVGESLPSMIGGAAIGRGLVAAAPKVAPWIAAALGEGTIAAGSAAEQIRGATEDKLLTAKQSLAALASGAGTALFGMAGGRLANKLGFDDVETMLVSGVSRNGPAKSALDFTKKALGSGVSEGVFEELPQSAQEQMWSNYALDKPLMEGVPEAAGMGAVTGFAMGAAGGGGARLLQKSPEQQIADAINENVAGTQFLGIDEQARAAFDPNSRAPTTQFIGGIPPQPLDTSPITAAGSLDEALAAADNAAGSLAITPPAPMPGLVAAAAPGLPVEPTLTPEPLTAAGPGLAIEPTLDLTAPLTETGLAPAPVSGMLPRLAERTTDTDLMSRISGQVPGLTAPRPQRIQGTPVANLTDDQLTTIASDESVPAITRRGASVELTARQAETAPVAREQAPLVPTPTPVPGEPLAAPAVPLAAAPMPAVPSQDVSAAQITDGTLTIPAEAGAPAPVRGGAAAPVGGRPESDAARAAATVSLDRWAAANGQVSPAVFAPAPADLEAGINTIGDALNSQFAGQLHAYYDPRPEALNGIAIGGAAFVNTGSVDINVARTSLHEFKHTVEQIARLETKQGLTNTPAQRFTAEIDGIFDQMTDAGKRAYIENFLHKDDLAGITDPAAREQRLQELMAAGNTRSEMTADFLGNRATDKRFWADVAKADPQGFAGFVERWLTVIDELISTLKGKSNQGKKESALVDKYVRDLKQAKAVARDALIAYSKAQRGVESGTNATAGSEGVSEPSASARQIPGEPGRAEIPEYGTARAGAISVVGRHYSPQPQQSLSGIYYGRGLKGAERDRLDGSPDPRLKNRIYFYVDTGAGVRPESGVGGYAHEVRLNNVYDPASKIVKPQSNLNAFESAVINAGFDGYIAPFGTNQSAVVLLGMKHKAVPVTQLGQVPSAGLPQAAPPTTLKKGLLGRELNEVNAANIPGARIRAGTLEVPTEQREAANAEMKRIGSEVQFSPREKEVPETLDAFAKLENIIPRARDGSFNTNRELKVDLQTAILAAAKDAKVNLSSRSAETEGYLTRVGVADALYAIRSNANAVGWYDKTVTKALRILGAIHPEINTDPNAKFAFTWALAVTSNGLKVDKNFELAERAYKAYKTTGKMPTNIQGGQAQKAINDSLDLFNTMVAQYGIDNVRKFMDSKFAVSQIKRATGLEVGGEFAETQVRGAAVLGPKIGNGFYSNLNGFFDQLTMDRWLMRTWGRWTGTLIEARPDMVKAKRDELRAFVVEMKQNAPAAAEFQKALGSKLVVGDLDGLALAIQKASMDPATRELFNKTKVGESLRTTGNSLAKYLDGQKEAPAGPEERNFIRKVFAQILKDVRANGHPALTMSDLQALLWYPEKRLYDIAKSDENAQEGYSDDEAPDYANAAAKLARGVGVSDASIQEAIREAEKDYESRISAGPTERAPGQPEAGPVAEAGVRGFGRQEQRQFLTTGIVHRVRSDRERDVEAPGPYSRKSGGDGRSLRVLGLPSVAVFSPAAKFKNALSEAPAATPKFFEVGSDGASTFRDSIQAAKDGSPFGAAVYVYDEADYRDMRMFLAEDGKAGFALKGNDIVSVFSGPPHTGAVNAIMQLAIQEGGQRLDAFDTVLPDLYAVHGFKIVARTSWNEDYKPDGWDKASFKEFNDGEPDVVFMAYDPDYFGMPANTDGAKISDYDEGAAKQAEALAAVPPRPTPSPELKMAKLFEGLEKRGLAKTKVEKAIDARPDADQIRFVQDQFLDILAALEDSGQVKINCK